MSESRSILDSSLPPRNQGQTKQGQHLDAPVGARRVLRLPDGATCLPFVKEPAAISRLRKSLSVRSANR